MAKVSPRKPAGKAPTVADQARLAPLESSEDSGRIPLVEPAKPRTPPAPGLIPAALLGAAYQAIADMHGAEVKFEGMGKVVPGGLLIMWADRRR